MFSLYSSQLQKANLKIHSLGNLQYIATSDTPEVVIGSGIHGDEWEVIPLLLETVLQLQSVLPSFLCIPILSPSSVESRTRVNGNGIDINRSFADPTCSDVEVIAIKTLMNHYKSYTTVITIHQDLKRREAYLYDGCVDPADPKITLWQEQMRTGGIDLLDEIDTHDDDCLGVPFTNGHYNFDPRSNTFVETFETWSSLHGGALRNLTLEVPGIGSISQKRYVIEQSLRTLL